jgi:hypothetical protein
VGYIKRKNANEWKTILSERYKNEPDVYELVCMLEDIAPGDFVDHQPLNLGLGAPAAGMKLLRTYFPAIKARGILWNKPVTMRLMEDKMCHYNSATLYEQLGQKCPYCTGFMHRDGEWSRHSWLYDGENDHIIETIKKPDLYFGYEMTHAEATEAIKYMRGGWMAKVTRETLMDAGMLGANHRIR